MTPPHDALALFYMLYGRSPLSEKSKALLEITAALDASNNEIACLKNKIIEIEANTASLLDASWKDYEEVLADHRRLVRELDVLMNGENAAKQASLCDIVGSFERWLETHDKSARAEEREACASSLDESVQYYAHEADSALKHNSDEIYYESNGAARAIRQLATEIRARGGGASSDCQHEYEGAYGVCMKCGHSLFDGPPLIDIKRFEQAPCYICGYSSGGYYQPESHSCATRYHAAVEAGTRDE